MSFKVEAQTIREYEAIGWGGKPTVTDLGRSTSDFPRLVLLAI